MEKYKYYTMGLALFDLLPVLLFLLSGLIIYSMYRSPLLLAGVLACFIGGLSKAVWKIIVVRRGADLSSLTRAFRMLMPAGFVLMMLSVPAGGIEAFRGLWRSLTMMPAVIFFAAGLALMCFMGYLGSHMDSSARSNWIEEAVNTMAQLAVLIAVIIVYFGNYYHAGSAALSAMQGTEKVNVTEITEEDTSCWLFDGPGTESALVFYPGAKVEAAAYAPLMEGIASGGTDCFLCSMPLNIALLDKDAADSIRESYRDKYRNWYIGGHSLGGATAAMAADDAEEAEPGEDWDGIILLAAYPTDEIDTPVLSVKGSRDGVLNSDRYEKADEDGLWPGDFEEIVIKGGNHAQFGDYGEQEGDNDAAIDASEQWKKTAEAVVRWIAGKQNGQ